MKLFRQFMHVSIRCNDIDKSIDFYNKLGFEVILDMSKNPGDKPWNYYLRIKRGEYIELQALSRQAPNPYLTPDQVVNNSNRSLWHFALETENLRFTIDNLRQNGITVWKDPSKHAPVEDYDKDVFRSVGGYDVAWLVDPDGNPIEMMQPVGVTLQQKNDYDD